MALACPLALSLVDIGLAHRNQIKSRSELFGKRRALCMSCRSGEKFAGKWSAPAVYSMGGASVGLQAGASSTDFVLLVMNAKGVDAVPADKTKLGSDATAAAGPSGASAESSSVGGADVLTYARAKGLFVLQVYPWKAPCPSSAHSDFSH